MFTVRVCFKLYDTGHCNTGNHHTEVSCLGFDDVHFDYCRMYEICYNKFLKNVKNDYGKSL